MTEFWGVFKQEHVVHRVWASALKVNIHTNCVADSVEVYEADMFKRRVRSAKGSIGRENARLRVVRRGGCRCRPWHREHRSHQPEQERREDGECIYTFLHDSSNRVLTRHVRRVCPLCALATRLQCPIYGGEIPACLAVTRRLGAA